MIVPGFTAGGFLIHFVRFASSTGERTPPAIDFLLATCVSSGPILPAAVVPFTVWHPTQGSDRNVSRPFFVAGSSSRFASFTASAAHASYSLFGCATSVM